MEKDFEKNLIVRTLNLQREFSQLTNDNLSSNLVEKVKNELNQLIQPLLSFIDPQLKNIDPNKASEHISSNLKKVFGITETIIDGYEKHYVQKSKSRVRSSFEYCEKPQLLFKDRIDNSERPFIPKLVEKHNKMTALDPYFIEYQKTEEAPSDFKFTHPYQHELERLKMDYSLLLKTLSNQVTQVNLESTQFSYVDSLDQLQSLVSKLSSQTNFAFDVHNHSFRSFLGFSCFLEISINSEDFLIDALKLREHLHLLNKPFTDPKILKVGMDTKEKLLWLQRDFGIYTVNLIDLGIMVEKLSLPDSLPFLSNKFLGFSFRDIYADFDFRKRPLTPNEKLFLRSFSHSMLRLFFALKEVTPKIGVDAFYSDVFEDSKKLCFALYAKPVPNEIPYKLSSDPQFNLQPAKFSKLKKLVSWRDYTARLEDESKEFILPDELIASILHNIPEDVEDLKERVKLYPLEVSTKHLDTVFMMIEDNDYFQENKEQSKHEVHENSAEILQSLFTPTRPMFRPANGNTLDKESPAYDQNDLHRIIRWSSGKKDGGEALETPRKLFDDFLMSSALRDSPDDNLGEDLIHIRNIINNRNDPSYVKREVQKIPFLRESGSKLKEIREEDPAIDSLEFSTVKENLPQNITEIYELGNNIRKRNKNKKKKDLKQTKPASEFLSSLDFSQNDSSQRLSYGPDRGGKSNKDDTVASDNILRDLGWI